MGNKVRKFYNLKEHAPLKKLDLVMLSEAKYPLYLKKPFAALLPPNGVQAVTAPFSVESKTPRASFGFG